MLLAEIIVDLGPAFLGVGIDAHAQPALVLRPQDGEQIVGRNAVQGHLELEITPVLGRLGALLSGLGHRGRNPAAPENLTQILADRGGLAEALRHDVPRTGERRLRIRHAALHELGVVLQRIARAHVPHQIRERLQAQLLRDRGAGAPLGPPGEVEVLQLRGGNAVLDLGAQLVRERTRLADDFQDGLLALLHLGEDVHPVADLRHIRVVHPAGLLLAVAADEGNGVAVREEFGAILNLPVLQVEEAGDVLDIDLFHFAGWSLRKRRPSTPQNASPKMLPDILEVPSLRLTKITGTSAMRKPRRWAVYLSSIWKP